jgi:LCCL domain
MEPDIARAAAAQVPRSQAATGGPEGCPLHLGINPNLPTPFTCTCSAAAAGTEAWIVAGTDVYTDNSNLCRAAVHAGAITTKGGPITVVRSEGRPYYVGSSRNGVATADFGSYGASIRFN